MRRWASSPLTAPAAWGELGGDQGIYVFVYLEAFPPERFQPTQPVAKLRVFRSGPGFDSNP